MQAEIKEDVASSLFAAQSGSNTVDDRASLIRSYYLIWLAVPLISGLFELVSDLVSIGEYDGFQRFVMMLLFLGGGLLLGGYVLFRPIDGYFRGQRGFTEAKRRLGVLAELGSLWTFCITLLSCVLADLTHIPILGHSSVGFFWWNLIPHILVSVYFSFLVLVLLADFRGRLRFSYIQYYHLESHNLGHRFRARFMMAMIASSVLPLVLAIYYVVTVDIFEVRQALVSLSAISVLSALLVYISYVRAINRPVYNLLAAFSAVQQGRYDVRVPVTTVDEIGVATDVFNTMMASLHERQQLLESYGGCLNPDQVENLMESLGKEKTKAGQATIVLVHLAPLLGGKFMTASAKQDEFIAIHRKIVQAVHAGGGTVLSITGNTVCASFNMPLPEASHVRQGVKVGLDIMMSLSVPVGVGVATGDVIGGVIGTSHDQRYALMGEAMHRVEVLARQSAEHDGGLLIDRGTQKMIDGFFDLRRMPVQTDEGVAYEVQPDGADVEWAQP